jgi:ABC-type enterochelin transport system substrate-binding protein
MTGEAASADTVTVIHHIDEAVIPLTPRIHIVLNQNIVLDLCDVFQERTPGVK